MKSCSIRQVRRLRAPNLWTLSALYQHIQMGPSTETRVGWVPARPEGFDSLGNRLQCAWKVFTGQADAIIWPEDEGS